MSTRPQNQLRILPTIVAGARPTDRAHVTIYRPFFLAGILIVLTTGCVLGAISLAGISARASYTTNVWTPYVLAHANSQLFGWVGFFIMGFALQSHPPRVDRAMVFHRLAYASLGLMATGILLRFLAEPLVAGNREVWLPVGIFSAVLQMVAVLLFLINTTYTRHRSGGGLTWPTLFVFASLGWMFAISVAEPFVFAYSHQVDAVASIFFVAKYMPLLRDAQFAGFVAMMIFGVGYVKLSECLGFQEPHRNLALGGFVLWNAGILGRMAGWMDYFQSDMDPTGGRLYFFAGAVMATGAFFLISATRVLEKPCFTIPAQKFLRSAMLWFGVTAVLLLLERQHLAIIGAPFSHAYTGAVRHAITVGFISQMILGVGMHVVSQHGEVPVGGQPSLWAALVLVNLGNAMRVFFQIGTDYNPVWFGPMGMSGFIELVGLLLWARYVLSVLIGARRKPLAIAA